MADLIRPRAKRRPAQRERIPFLVRDHAGNWYWKPSARFRPTFSNVPLGTDRAQAETQAIELTRRARAWAQSAAGRAAARTERRPNRLPQSLGELLAAYRARGMDHMRETTRREALSLMKRIEARFADEPLTALTKPVLRAWLNEIGFAAPQSRRQLGLRLRAIWNWARDEELTSLPNPVEKARIGTGRKRPTRMSWEDARALIVAADALDLPAIGDLIVLTFACVMRLSDAVALTHGAIRLTPLPDGGTQWRLVYTQAKGMKPTGKRGELEGGRVIDMAVPALVVARLGQRLSLGQSRPGALICPDRSARRWTDEALARAFRAVKAKARETRPEIDPGLHLRDGRRSGFVAYVLDGALIEWVCSISGHTIKEGYDIVEHYLPKTPEQADQAVRLLTARL